MRGAGDEEVPGSQRRKLVLLAYLALAQPPTPRATIVEMFWGDEDVDRARHSLSNALWFLRHVLGADSVTSHRAEISLAHDVALEVDAVQLQAAAARGDRERIIELYKGPFLDGIHIPESVSFEQWLSGQRSRLELAFTRACAAECMTVAAGRNWDRCATVARRWLELVPTSAEAALHLLNALRASRTHDGRCAALAAYQLLATRLEHEHGTSPAPAVVALAARIKEHLDAGYDAAAAIEPQTISVVRLAPLPGVADERLDAEPIVASTQTATPVALSSSTQGPFRHASARFTSHWIASAIATLAIIGMTGFGFVHLRTRAGGAESSAAAIAITDIDNLNRDTSSAWLEDGFAQMLASDIAREANAEVIAPTRVRDTRARAELPITGALAPDVALDIAHRVGATLAVRGGFTHGAGTFVLDIAVRNVGTGRTVRSFTVTGSDPITLAAQAAARIVEGSGEDAAGARFSGVETSSVLAYQHFVRALQAEDAGRFSDEQRELDATIALDSEFADAIVKRRDIATADDDSAVAARLGEALLHVRLTPWDAQTQAIDSALHNAEMARSERLARALVSRYPHDPRSYDMLGAVLYNEGDWAGMQATYEQQLALDSLAISAGSGPCVPCRAIDALVTVHTFRGDEAGGERVAQRGVHLQPDLPHAWAVLSTALDFAGRHAAAIDAQRRALMLSGNERYYEIRLARTLISGRRLDDAESLVQRRNATPSHGTLHNSPEAHGRDADAFDIHTLVQRERGQMRASIRSIDDYLSHRPADYVLRLEQIDALGRLGDFAGVSRAFNKYFSSIPSPSPDASDAVLAGDRARYFCWTRAIEANALAGSGDTLRLKALADSIRITSALSYYGRDRRLHHHLLGLVAFIGKRYPEAEREFAAARWGVAGWTETVAWQARAELAENQPVRAIATLREAYEGPLDAMGRYQPRSELDYLLSAAFAQTAQTDSAKVYARYAHDALKSADPEVQKQIQALLPSVDLASAVVNP